MDVLSTNAAHMTYCLYADPFYNMLNNSVRTAGVSSEIMKITPSLAKVWSLTQDLLLYGTAANLSVCIPSQHRVYFHSQWASERMCV